MRSGTPQPKGWATTLIIVPGVAFIGIALFFFGVFLAYGAQAEEIDRPQEAGQYLGPENKDVRMSLSDFSQWLAYARKELEKRGCITPIISGKTDSRGVFSAAWHCDKWRLEPLTRFSAEKKEGEK